MLTWFLDLYQRNPAVAIDARLALAPDPPPGLYDGYTKEQTAAFFGVRTEAIDGMVRNGMPIQRRGRRPGGVGKHQRSGFNLADCAEWICEQKTKNIASTAESEAIAEADILYRQEKTKMQELKRKQLEGQLIDVQVWSERVSAGIDAIRKGVESYHRTFGDEAVETLTKLIDEVEQVFLGDDRDQHQPDREE